MSPAGDFENPSDRSGRPDALRVRLTGAGKTFERNVVAIDRIDLDVAPGEFVALLGPSGCGKSTLLRLVAGLDRADRGTVEVAALTPRRKGDLSFVFQDAHLLPWRTVRANVALPLELLRVAPAARDMAVDASLEQVGLTEAAERYPSQLSGGMRMRASLARALVTEPRLLLLDEPFAALDEITRQRLDDDLRRLRAETGATVIFVTHSIVEAAFLADRVVVFSKAPAQIVLDHRLDLPDERPSSLRAEASFARQTRMLFDALDRGQA